MTTPAAPAPYVLARNATALVWRQDAYVDASDASNPFLRPFDLWLAAQTLTADPNFQRAVFTIEVDVDPDPRLAADPVTALLGGYTIPEVDPNSPTVWDNDVAPVVSGNSNGGFTYYFPQSSSWLGSPSLSPTPLHVNSYARLDHFAQTAVPPIVIVAVRAYRTYWVRAHPVLNLQVAPSSGRPPLTVDLSGSLGMGAF